MIYFTQLIIILNDQINKLSEIYNQFTESQKKTKLITPQLYVE